MIGKQEPIESEGLPLTPKQAKFVGVVTIASIVVFASQWYPRYSFYKYAGFKLPAISIAVKWSSDQQDFFAAYLTTPGSARRFIEQDQIGGEWRNDTLNVKLSPTHRNVPFFDLNGYELIRPDRGRWFHANIRKLDPKKHLHKGFAVIVYPDKGLIYISAGK